MKFVPFAIAVPFVNLYGLILLGTLIGWLFTIFIGLATVIAFVLIHKQNVLLTSVKVKESILNDKRLKTVKDIVSGIRAIKSYAWEHLFLERLNIWRR